MPLPYFYILKERFFILEVYHSLNDIDLANKNVEKYITTDNVSKTDTITTVFDNDAVLRQNYEDSKYDGFSADKTLRLVAHIDMNTVRLLAHSKKDLDAYDYITYGDTDARDRMIKNYPDLFKACSGRI